MKKILTLVLLILIFLSQNNFAQKLGISYLPTLSTDAPDWIKQLYTDTINWKQLEDAYHSYYTNHTFEKNIYTQYYKRWMLENKKFMMDDGSIVKEQSPNTLPFKSTRGSNSEWQVIGPLQTFGKMQNGSQPASPTQVNIYSFDIAPSNANILYASPESGGLFKTINKGVDWISVSDTLPMENILAIAIHPTNPDIVYAGGYDKIYKTVNGGGSWTVIQTTPNLSVHDIAIVPNTPNTILCATDLGLYTSTNAGTTWTIVTAMNSPVYDIEINHLNNNSIYVLKKNNATTHSEFFRSTNMGSTFVQMNTGWISGTDNGGRLAITNADTNRIYAVLLMLTPTGAPAILRSNNGGTSWLTTVQSMETGLAGTNIGALGMSNGQGFYDLSIMANNSNADDVIVGTTSIYKSTDGANNFIRIGGYGGSFNLHPDVQEMKMLGNDAWISTDGGIIFSSDFFTATTNYDTRLNGIYGSAFWGFGQGWNEDILCGGRYHNGNTAMYQSYPTGKALALGGAESGTGFAMLGKDRHVSHSDIGGTIIPSTFSGTDYSTFSVSKYPNEDGYGFDAGEMEFQYNCFNHIYITKDSSLWKSIDGGLSFTEIFHFTNKTKKFEICKSNPSIMYLATNNQLYKTNDTGFTWNAIVLPTGVSMSKMAIAVSHVDANIFWITSRSNTSNNKVHKTVDGGNTFTNLTSALINPYKFYTIVHHAGSDGGVYILGEDNGKVFYTNNALGSAWVDFSKKLPKIFDPVGAKIFYKNGKLRTAGNRGIWQIDLYEDAPPIAQPTVDKLNSYCSKDTFYFDDFSTLNHNNATWQWSFPSASFINNTAIRNPKVLYPAQGTYTATLVVTNAAGQSSTKSITVSISASECEIDTVVGGALKISGQSKFAVANNINLPNTTAYTIMAWIKGSGTQVDYAGIFGIDLGNNAYAHLNVRTVNADSTEIGYHHPNGAWSYSSGLYLKPNEWTHVALVVQPTQISIYKNGIKATHTGLTIPIANLGPSLKIGTMITREYDRCFWGLIDEVALYKYALSTNEIRDMMHLTKQNPNYSIQSNPNLVAYYQFNETNSNKSFDKINGHHLGYQNVIRVPSTAPIGGGNSYRINGINAAGNNTFTNTSVDINFANGINPNGDVIVSALHVMPDVKPGSFATQNKYYIINNFGTNKTFAPLSNIKFSNFINLMPNFANNFELYKRPSNADGATWGGVQDIADTMETTGNASSITFSTTNNITNLGQFYIASKVPLIPLSISPDIVSDFSFTLFPNPALNNLYISIENKSNSSEGYIEITNTNGSKLKSTKVQLKQGINKIWMPLESVASGIYIVTIQIGNHYNSQKIEIQ